MPQEVQEVQEPRAIYIQVGTWDLGLGRKRESEIPKYEVVTGNCGMADDNNNSSGSTSNSNSTGSSTNTSNSKPAIYAAMHKEKVKSNTHVHRVMTILSICQPAQPAQPSLPTYPTMSTISNSPEDLASVHERTKYDIPSTRQAKHIDIANRSYHIASYRIAYIASKVFLQYT
jgi:hypothetical protein